MVMKAGTVQHFWILYSGKIKGACWPLCYSGISKSFPALKKWKIQKKSISSCLGNTGRKHHQRKIFACAWMLWLSMLSFDLKVFFIFPGPLRSSTCPPSGRSTSPHCSTHRSPPFTPPISVASCRCPRPLPHHACCEPCPKWKTTQGWERWEQTFISIQKNVSKLVKYRASIQIHTGRAHVNPHNPHLKYPYTNTHTENTAIHIDPYLKNAGWRHTGPLAVCCLVQSVQM